MDVRGTRCVGDNRIDRLKIDASVKALVETCAKPGTTDGHRRKPRELLSGTPIQARK